MQEFGFTFALYALPRTFCCYGLSLSPCRDCGWIFVERSVVVRLPSYFF